MRRLLRSILSVLVVLPLAPTGVFAFDFTPNYVISDAEMTDAASMSRAQIQSFLDAYGTLGSRSFEDVDGATKPAAQIIFDAANRNQISPRVILVTLQKEQSLVDDASPTQDQLDWAMGYGICDDCNHDTEAAQRFRGFAKQVNSATLQFGAGYMADLAAFGKTLAGFGPGVTVAVDDILLTPANDATAALYTYTPHTHGNANFSRLWNKWFSHDYPDGSLLQNAEDGGVWLIQYGLRRPITSRAAFLTRFNERSIVQVSPTALEAFPTGRAISLPNYSLLRSPRGTVYLLVDDTLRGFVSREAMRSVGLNPEDALDVSFEDIAAYEEGTPITSDTVYPQGALLQDTATGGVFFVENGSKAPIMSREIMNTKFTNLSVQPAEAGELDAYPTVAPVTFPDGTLISPEGKSDIYVVSGGKRLPIPNGDTFLSFGWKWEQVVKTNERAVDIHPLGEPIQATVETVEPNDTQSL